MYVLDQKLGRRKFLQVAGAAAAPTATGIGVSGCTSLGSQEHPIAADPAGITQWGREAGQWIPSCCNMCGGQSGIMVHVVNGVAEKIEPNNWNPNNYSNISSDFFSGYTPEYGCAEGGVLCPKGNAGIVQLYDPDRLKNPVKRTMPGNQTVAKALAKLETLVVVDTHLSETAMMADYVLPGTTYLERYDLNSHWVTWPVLGLRQPVVKPLFGQPAEYETVAALGRRLGLKDKEGKDFFTVGAVSGRPVADLTAWYEEFLSNELKEGAPKITLEQLKALPGAVWVEKKGTRYEKYAEPLTPEQLKGAFFDGNPRAEGTAIYDKPKDQKGKRIGTVIGSRAVKGFMTKSGKVEFSAKWLAEKMDANGKPVNPLPAYEPRDWQPSAEYPLYFINWKEANHTHSRTQNNPWLLDIKPDNPMVINPATAQKYGVRDGDTVWVESPHGRVKARAKVTTRIHPEVIGVQHGFGHTALGRLAKGRGTGDSPLRPTKSDPLSGQAMHKEACVRIVKA